jgi:serralysin
MTRSRLLVIAAVLIASLLVPASPAAADSPASKMIRKVNAYRKHRGLRPLHQSRSLNHSSHRYASQMMRSGYFGHSRRIHASRRFRRLGEIIEMHRGNRSNVGGALRAWINSPGHNAILLDGNFSYVGAGLAEGRFHGRRTTMWVMHFGHK